jgi:hypothetical protein
MYLTQEHFYGTKWKCVINMFHSGFAFARKRIRKVKTEKIPKDTDMSHSYERLGSKKYSDIDQIHFITFSKTYSLLVARSMREQIKCPFCYSSSYSNLCRSNLLMNSIRVTSLDRFGGTKVLNIRDDGRVFFQTFWINMIHKTCCKCA